MKERVPILDLMRTFAIFLICLNHSISLFYLDQISYETFNSISLVSKSFMVAGYIISRLGVPLFLFLTGILLINKNFESYEDIKRFYKKNLLSLIISVVIWNFIYYFINILLTNGKFNFIVLIRILLFIDKSVYGHMWYMPMIIGMYIFIPFISIIVKKYTLKQMIIPILLLIFNYFLINDINGLLQIFNNNFTMDLNIPLNFMGAQYGIYIILAYYIYKDSKIKEIKNITLIIFGLVTFILSLVFQVMLYKSNLRHIVYYNSIFILITSLSLFIYLLKLNIKEFKIISYLSKNSLAIYFVHFPILLAMNKYITINLSKPIMTLLFLIISIIISIIIIEIIKQFKISKKYLLRQ